MVKRKSLMKKGAGELKKKSFLAEHKLFSKEQQAETKDSNREVINLVIPRIDYQNLSSPVKNSPSKNDVETEVADFTYQGSP